jgi:hypothetical protein
MFGTVRPKEFRKAILGMSEKGMLDEALIRKYQQRLPKLPKPVVVSLEGVREIEKVQRLGEGLLREIRRFSVDNPDVVGIPEWETRIKSAIEKLNG